LKFFLAQLPSARRRISRPAIPPLQSQPPRLSGDSACREPSHYFGYYNSHMPAVGKKLHHFVPKLYLRAWAPDERIFCLQDGQVTFRNLEKVGAENYFYRLNEISPEDAEFIENGIIADSPEGLRETHRFLMHAFTVPHKAKRVLEQTGKARFEEMLLVDQQIVEMNENYHTSIENLFQPLLQSMKEGDLTFLNDEEKRHAFYFGLSVQYSRTNHIKRSRELMNDEKYERYMRLANILTHIVAMNVARSLFGNHETYRVVLLDNATEIPFVTADQPAINLSAHPLNLEPPGKFELYYPLSPRKAMILAEAESRHLPREHSVSAGQAHLYNLRIAAHSYRQVYANSKSELEAVNAELGAFLSCF
jgi:hypothetical protein